MLKKIKVYGRLRKFIGQAVLEADVNSPLEALSFLHCNFKGLEKHMADQYYQINAGDTKITEDLLGIRTNCDIQIIPLAHGNFFFTLALGGLFSAGGAAIGAKLLGSKLLATVVSGALTSIGTNQGTYVANGNAGEVPVTLTGPTTVAEANAVAALTTGAVTATISQGTMAALTTLTGNETGHAYTITVTDTTADAGQLNTINGQTTVAVDLSALTTITGDEAEFRTLYAANAATPATVTGLGNEALTCSGDAAGNALTVAEMNVLSGLTTGVITATIATGNLATLNGITESGNALALTINDATLDAAALNNLRAKTTGVVTLSANPLAINGTTSDIAAIYAAQNAGTVGVRATGDRL